MKNDGTVKMSTPNRIMHLVETRWPTSIGLLSCDTGLKVETVRRHVNALIADGRLQYGADGNEIEFTDSERETRHFEKTSTEAIRKAVNAHIMRTALAK